MPSSQRPAGSQPASAPQHSTGTTGRRIPDIPWREDNGRLIWSLLAEIEKDENRHVFLGKADKADNTKGDSKTKVCKRIAEAILPDLYDLSPTTMGDRIKSKIEALIKDYKKHSKRLIETGGGIRNEPDENSGGDSAESTLSFYIYSDGPNDETPDFARNLWDAIIAEFPFFPVLHRMFGARPNVVPILVSTGVGPNGGQTIWYQPPDDSVIDPALRSSPQPITPPNLLQTPIPSSPVTPTPQARPPKPSTNSRLALEKAAAIKVIPQKSSIAEAMITISQRTFDALERKNMLEQATAQRAQALAEFKEGLISKDEWQKEIRRIKRQFSPPSPQPLTAPRYNLDGDYSEEDA